MIVILVQRKVVHYSVDYVIDRFSVINRVDQCDVANQLNVDLQVFYMIVYLNR